MASRTRQRPTSVLIAMAGLPGAGKSTLARALAGPLGAVVLDKDEIRAALFGPATDHSSEQNDFCVEIMYRTAGWLLTRDRRRPVLLDGRPYLRSGQVADLRRVGAELGVPLRIIECVCAEDVAVARIEHDRRAGRHPAANRDAALHRRLRAEAEPIDEPTLRVDTGQPLDDCVERCLSCLRGLAESDCRTSPRGSS